MKIGITEYGDAGVDFRWENKLKEIDGVILITKNLNDTFIKKVLNHMSEIPIVVHCTCTGLSLDFRQAEWYCVLILFSQLRRVSSEFPRC